MSEKITYICDFCHKPIVEWSDATNRLDSGKDICNSCAINFLQRFICDKCERQLENAALDDGDCKKEDSDNE